jgi:hypothetical protein
MAGTGGQLACDEGYAECLRLRLLVENNADLDFKAMMVGLGLIWSACMVGQVPAPARREQRRYGR